MTEPIKKYTADEYYEDKSLPERCELINGVIFRDIPAPHLIHQVMIRDILTPIAGYVGRHKGESIVLRGPSDVKLTEDTVVQPDIYITCNPGLLDGQKHNGAPDWVIEVVDPAIAMHDYITKAKLYYDNGVREYWIVDPDKKKVGVYIWDGDNKDINIYSFNDDIPVYIYTECEEKLYINISEFFK